MARQCSPTPVGLSRYVCSLNIWLCVLYVCVVAVDVTRDVIDGSTSVFFRCFVFKVYYHQAEGVRWLYSVVFMITVALSLSAGNMVMELSCFSVCIALLSPLLM